MHLLIAALLAASSIHSVEDLNAAQIAKLDRDHTVIILVGTILEEHGPYVPINADGFRNERIADALAHAIAARPGWNVLLFPVIPLGSGPFDQSMGRGDFVGSFPVRVRTLEAVFMDLADELGRQGFKYGFIVHGHGEPDHNRALDLAGDYFHETYG